jgi:hypothetical protein
MAYEAAPAKQDSKLDEIVGELIKLYERLSGKRGNWESHWQEIAERIWTSQARLFQGGRMNMTTGEKRTEQMFDATASTALDRFSNILDSILTPSSQTWHKVTPSNPYLAKDREVSLWFEELNRMLFKMRYAPLSNFISQNQLVYKMDGAYGTGCLFIDELRNWSRAPTGFRYKSIHLSEVYLAENHQGIIDTAVRYWPWEARQAAQEFGEKNLPECIRSCLKSNPDREFPFLHVVKPRKDFDPERRDHKGMHFASYYISIQERYLIDEGGYDTFPYATSRYEQVPGEPYGRSPAMIVLPAIMTLNEEKKTVLTQGHRAVAPVLLAHDDGIVDTFSLRPGALNAGGVNADGRALVHALPVGNIAIGKDLMDDERNDIKDGFLVSLFQILVDNPQMTATEVMERVKEKGMLIGPSLSRQYSDYHAPMIDREISLMSRMGKLPPNIPQVLLEAEGEYDITFESPLTRSQRAEEAAGGMRVLSEAREMAVTTGDPRWLDHFNPDVIVPDLSDIHGMPVRWRYGADQIMAQRQQRAQDKQQEQAVAAAPGAAAMIKAGAVAEKQAKAR